MNRKLLWAVFVIGLALITVGEFYELAAGGEIVFT